MIQDLNSHPFFTSFMPLFSDHPQAQEQASLSVFYIIDNPALQNSVPKYRLGYDLPVFSSIEGYFCPIDSPKTSFSFGNLLSRLAGQSESPSGSSPSRVFSPESGLQQDLRDSNFKCLRALPEYFRSRVFFSFPFRVFEYLSKKKKNEQTVWLCPSSVV